MKEKMEYKTFEKIISYFENISVLLTENPVSYGMGHLTE